MDVDAIQTILRQGTSSNARPPMVSRLLLKAQPSSSRRGELDRRLCQRERCYSCTRRCLVRARIVELIIGSAVPVEISRSHHAPVRWNSRTMAAWICTCFSYTVSLWRGSLVEQQIIWVPIPVEIRNPYHAPACRKSRTMVACSHERCCSYTKSLWRA